MSLSDLISQVVKNLQANKLRCLLSMVGIIIGIAAVIVVLSAGNSLQSFVLSQLEVFGSDFVFVEVKIPNTSHHSTDNAIGMATGITITTLTLKDMEDIMEVPEIANAYAGIMGQELVSYREEAKKTNLYGVSASFPQIDKAAQLKSGVFFTKSQDDHLEKVAVLGSDVAAKLFASEDPLQKKIRIGKEKYTVIGVAKERGNDLFMNMDDLIMVPVQTLQKKNLGVDYVNFIFAKAKSEDAANQAVAPIQKILRDNHNIPQGNPDKDDFAVSTLAESQDLISTILGGMTIILSVIASISLLVGGVGIMNIMYVSVVERTFEIGLRKAVGASRQSIMRQFLLEAVVITFVGGVIGVISGVLVSYLISVVAGTQGFAWPFSVSLPAIFLSTIFSVCVGLVFGLSPARRASKLDSVVALQQE